MDKSKIDWSKAPEWAGVVIKSQPGKLYFARHFGGNDCERISIEGADGGWAQFGKHSSWEFVEARPTAESAKPANSAKPAIATLEERIRKQAISAFGFKVVEIMHDVRCLAQAALDKPSGINDLDIGLAIDLVCSAIIREAGPLKADQALDKALAELTRTLTK